MFRTGVLVSDAYRAIRPEDDVFIDEKQICRFVLHHFPKFCATFRTTSMCLHAEKDAEHNMSTHIRTKRHAMQPKVI